MGMEDDDDDGQNHGNTNEKKSSFVINIPSYQEVIKSSQRTTAPSSLFSPSPSFSQSFSFVKKSEFYAEPPPSASCQAPQTSKIAPSGSTLPGSDRRIGQSEVTPPTSSFSSSAPGGTSSASATLSGQSRNAILVSHRQQGNPLLKHIRNVRWDFADVVCDYLLGQNSCALYISLRYHLLHPDYLYYRIRELQKNFKLRVVLCHVDVEDVVKPLLEVTRTALLHDCTLLCGWSLEECGRYLETIKVYENKSADIIQGQMDTDYSSRLTHTLTTVRRVNKTDVVTLGSTFGSLSHVMDASMDDLARCPGIGERKVKRLYDTFHEPFKRVISSQPAVPEAPVQGNAEPCPVSKESEEKDGGDAGSGKKKEPQLTVKSTLSAALSKHSNKLSRKKTKQGEKGEETSAAGEARFKNKNWEA